MLQLFLLLTLAALDALTASSGEVVRALRRLFATFVGQLRRGLDWFALVSWTLGILTWEDVADFLRLDALEDSFEVRTTQGLLLQQFFGQNVQVVPVFTQDVVGGVLGLVHQHADVFIHDCCDLFGWLELSATATANEWVALFLTELHRTHARAHAVFHDHGLGDLRRHLNIGGGAGGRVAEDQFLGCASTHGEHKPGEELRAVVHALVVFLGSHRVPASAAASQDRNLVDPLDVLHRPRSQGVATLVVGGDLLFVLRNDLGAATWAADHAVGGFFQRVGGNHVAFHTRGQQGGFVQHVFQVRTGHTGGALRQRSQVHVRRQWLALRVDAQELLAPQQVWVGHWDLSVESAWAQQRWVQHIWPVRSRHEDHAITIAETVHLHQQLVKGLLAFVVATAHAGATLASDSVDLVDEDDARRVFLRLLEQVANARGTHTNEHFHEVGTGDAEERHPRFACHGTREQRLTRAGRTVEQHATRDLRAQLFVFLGVGQEIADLVEFLDCFVGTGDVIKRCLRVVLLQILRAGLAEAEGTHSPAALHAGQHEHQQAEDQQHRQEHHQHAAEEGIPRHTRVIFLGFRALHRVKDRLTGAGRVVGRDLFDPVLTFDLDRLLQLQLQRLFAVFDLRFFDVLIPQLLHRNAGFDLVETPVVVRQHAEGINRDEDGGDDAGDPQDLLFVHFSNHWLYAVKLRGVLSRSVAARGAHGATVLELVDLGLQGAHERQVAVAFREVQSIANNKLVGNIESHFSHVFNFYLQRIWLAQQSHDRQGPWLAVIQVLHQPGQGEARVDDVLDDQHIAVLDLPIQILKNTHHARGTSGISIRADSHEFQLHRYIQFAGEVGNEEHRALEHADQDQVILGVLVLFAGRLGQFADPRVQSVLVDQYCFQVVSVWVFWNVTALRDGCCFCHGNIDPLRSVCVCFAAANLTR